MIVITGTGKSGSWRIRGGQLGAAIGAHVVPRCEDFRGYSTAVYVKRVRPEVLAALRKARIRWVWDIVDAWPQPEGNLWGEDQAVAWLRGELARLQPHAVVFTTEAMRADSGWQGPSLVLPHHAWPRYQRTEARHAVEVVGYEGARHYLGAWEPLLLEACARRGWRFDVNGDMQDCDIGVALRDFDGHPARRWKSNVKLANIQALGVPALCSREAGYVEFAGGAEVFIDTPQQVDAALDRCTSQDLRASARQVQVITLGRVAQDYKAWLASNF